VGYKNAGSVLDALVFLKKLKGGKREVARNGGRESQKELQFPPYKIQRKVLARTNGGESLRGWEGGVKRRTCRGSAQEKGNMRDFSRKENGWLRRAR